MPERILDLGAGTGRIGHAFVVASDFYVGVDLSWAMLREFAAHSPNALLLQVDGRNLPFSNCTFDLVLLMQVLSGAEDWRGLLQETLRVLALPGAIVVGQSVTPDFGVDEQLKRQLAMILKETGVEAHEPKKSRQGALAWLNSRAGRHQSLTAAKWTVQRSPAQFLARHQTGARFSALPAAVQKEALERLSAWAETRFGSLEKSFTEEHSFRLEIFEVNAIK